MTTTKTTSLNVARCDRDDAYAACWQSARANGYVGDEYGMWLRCGAAEKAAYNAACDKVDAALRDTKYAGADPEHI